MSVSNARDLREMFEQRYLIEWRKFRACTPDFMRSSVTGEYADYGVEIAWRTFGAGREVELS